MRKRHRSGMSLVEVMIASGIASLMAAAVIASFLNQAKQFRRQNDISEIRQNVRTAADAIARDLRNAGYGLVLRGRNVEDWVDWGPPASNALTVIEGSGGAPDQLILVGAFDSPASLAGAVSAGSTIIDLGSGEGSRFNTSSQKLISIGRVELARITSINADQIIISTDPLSVQGLRYAHPAGTPIALIDAVRYGCEPSPAGFPFHPYLFRDAYRAGVTNDVQKLHTMRIDDLQVSVSDLQVTLRVRARTSRAEQGYTHPTEGDSYRRAERTVIIERRNPVR